MPGRTPKPLALHVLEGTLNVTDHRKRMEGEPRPKGRLGAPPLHFTPDQKNVWREQLLKCPPGLMKGIDRAVFQVWVVAVVAHQDASMELSQQTLLVPTSTKTSPEMKANPLINVINRQAEIILQSGAQCGFSPGSRGRVTVDNRAGEVDGGFIFPD